MSVNTFHVSEIYSVPPRPIALDPTISAEKARTLTEISIREKVFELIKEAAKAGKYKELIPNLPIFLIEELENLGYKIDFKVGIGEYKVDWSKDNGAS